MDEVFVFLTQFMLAYLLLGCLLTAALALSLRLFSLNAAARHKIWLTALLVLVLAPLLSLLPSASKDAPLSSSGSGGVATADVMSSRPSMSPDEYQSTVSRDLDFGASADYLLPGQATNVAASAFSLEALSAVLVKIPMYRELSVGFCLLLLLGVILKLYQYHRSLRALRALVASSVPVMGDWIDVLGQCSKLMQMGRGIELRQSNMISTPSTCGVLRPCIILPNKMVHDSCFVASRAQVLQHELAHIKRLDPLVAGLQAVVSAVLFWHPAVGYINKKIRYEREIACDDWVVSNNCQSGNAAVKAYAYSMVGIAESLSAHATPAHSVACVNDTLGLQERIRTLLDRRANHSTSVEFVPNVWMAAMALGFLFSSSSVLPKLPQNLFEQFEDSAIPEAGAITVKPYVLTMEEQPHSARELVVSTNARQLIDYAAPLPMPAMSSLSAEKEFSAVASRAASIELEFVARSREAPLPDTLTVELLEPAFDGVASVDLSLDQQEGSASVAQDPIAANQDEWIIIDNLSRTELAAEIMKIELELYRVFNSITDRNDLKMRCAKETVLGSFISQTVCEPEFLRAARSEKLRNSMGASGMNSFDMSAGLAVEMKADYEELAQEILQEMKGNRYLRELYQVLAGLKGRLVELA
ncbi:MAG: hypothetical protein DHS20C12_07810 [Pseudohongiella sp.]|nr:MAG: hypothetical protein DHS20C12_07810 [Pseudohongiella sp.]